MGAATRALCKPTGDGTAAIQCTSLKSNVGHLEPAAAAAGLASLVVGPLMASVVAVNAQLRGYVPCVSQTLSLYSYFILTQAERAPVVDRVVEAVPDARRRGSTYDSTQRLTTELVWV